VSLFVYLSVLNILLVCGVLVCTGFEVRIRSKASADEASKLLSKVLDTAMRVRSSCCPSVPLRCLVLSALDLQSGIAEPRGWPAKAAWNAKMLPRKVKFISFCVWTHNLIALFAPCG
jgi:hypothetical protein